MFSISTSKIQYHQGSDHIDTACGRNDFRSDSDPAIQKQRHATSRYDDQQPQQLEFRGIRPALIQ